MKDAKIALRLIYLKSAEPDVVKELANVDVSESLESIALKHMDSTSHQISDVIVDGEIANGQLSLEKQFMGRGHDERGKGVGEGEGEGSVEEMKVVHILLVDKPPDRRYGGDIIIFVSELRGRNHKHYIDRCATILELKEKIEDSEGSPVDAMRLIYEGRCLDDERSLEDYNIEKEATVHLNLRGRR